jgi:hypothetical protein
MAKQVQRTCLTIVFSMLLSGCGGWNYKVDEEVIFVIRSWNHDPIIRKVEKADPNTFEQLEEGFGKDGKSVFYKGVEINGADPKTFKHMRWAYSKDKNGVYLFTCKLQSANPETFLLLDGSWGKDNQRVYHGHQPVEADPVTFRFVGKNWAIDKSSALVRPEKSRQFLW